MYMVTLKVVVVGYDANDRQPKILLSENNFLPHSTLDKGGFESTLDAIIKLSIHADPKWVGLELFHIRDYIDEYWGGQFVVVSWKGRIPTDIPLKPGYRWASFAETRKLDREDRKLIDEALINANIR